MLLHLLGFKCLRSSFYTCRCYVHYVNHVTLGTHELFFSLVSDKVDRNENDAAKGLPESSVNRIKMTFVKEASREM